MYVSSVIWHAVLYEYLDLDWTGWRSLAVSSMSGYWIQLKTLCSKFSKVPPFLTYNTKWPNTFNNILIEISPLYIELFYENLHQSWLQSDPFQVKWNATWNHHELICNKHFGNNLKRDILNEAKICPVPNTSCILRVRTWIVALNFVS